MSDFVTTTLLDSAYVVAAFMVLAMAKILLALTTPFKIDDELSAKDNPAYGPSVVGYYLGVLIVFIGATAGDLGEVKTSSIPMVLAMDMGWVIGGVGFLNIARISLDLLVLRKFSTRKEIVEDRNVGMGAVEFGTYIASALIVAGAISGQGGSVVTALAFWALGQATLLVFALLYQILVPYDLHAELESDNVAAGVAYAGNMIAAAVVLMRGLGSDFISWSENLTFFGFYCAAAVVVVVVGRYIIDLLLLPGRTFKEEIVDDRNINVGYLEGGVLVGIAAVAAFIV